MAKRSVGGFAPGVAIDRWFGEPYYTTADIEAILKEFPVPAGEVEIKRFWTDEAGWNSYVSPRREALVERLESAARSFGVDAAWRAAPTGKQLEAHCRRIKSATTALLDALGAPEGDRDAMPDALRLSRQPPDADDLQAVVRLRQWAQDGIVEAKGRPAVPPHAGDEALDEFIGCLARIWRDVFGREPARTCNRRSRRPGGPFARFVLAALKPLRGDSTPTELQMAERIKRLGVN